MPPIYFAKNPDRPATPEELAAALFRPGYCTPGTQILSEPNGVLLLMVGRIIYDWLESGYNLDQTYISVKDMITELIHLLEEMGVPGAVERLEVLWGELRLNEPMPFRLGKKEGVPCKR